jgi:uncharacterized protein YciI
MSSQDLLGGAGTAMPETTGLELDQLTVVLLHEGPRYSDYSPDQAQALANEHLAYTVRLVADGHLLHAGALVDERSGPRFTGLGISRLSPAQLVPLIRRDPSVVAGLEDFRVVTHVFPKGSLDFQGERETAG